MNLKKNVNEVWDFAAGLCISTLETMYIQFVSILTAKYLLRNKVLVNSNPT